MISELIKASFTPLLSFIDWLVPKSNRFCFYTTPRTFWDPNQQALYQYVRTNTQEHCIVVDGNLLSKYKPWQSFLVFWQLLRSKVIIFDHSIPPGLNSSRHIRVNLWHGVPLKKIRFHLSNINAQVYAARQAPITDLLTTNSHYDALLMSSVMNVPRYNVVATGLPRNDYLLCTYNELLSLDIYNDVEKLERLREGFTRVILWAPTFRGHPRDLQSSFTLTHEQQLQLCRLLEQQNACLWLRTHKFATMSSVDTLLNHPNVFHVSNISNANIILRYTDLLITDYSSIWIDFLLLDKPIIIFAQDYKQYNQQPGFVLDYKQQIPVSLIERFEFLLKEIENDFHRLPFSGYLESKNKFHHVDHLSNKSQQVYQAIKRFKRLPFYILNKRA